jgi:methyl-accepting chemotaxis protein
MGLRLKFNLVLVVVFLAGFGAAGFVSRELLLENARDEVVRDARLMLRDARLMLEAAGSMRTYTVDQIRPHLIKEMEEVFLPQSVPAYAATETINTMRKKYTEYSYKEATLNPTNPRNRTLDWEADIVNRFRNYPDVKEIVSERASSTGRSLFIAKPIQISNLACLQCHSTAAAAPPTMIKIYGEANGFGWKHNEIVGAQVVTVPMDVPLRKAERAFTTFMASLAAVFFAVFIVLNIMLSWLIVRPIRRMSQSADKISTGEFGEPEFNEKGRDEVAVLGSSFNRMRRSLEKAMQMIGDQ